MELKRARVTLIKKLGSGAFGEVMLGSLAPEGSAL